MFKRNAKLERQNVKVFTSLAVGSRQSAVAVDCRRHMSTKESRYDFLAGTKPAIANLYPCIKTNHTWSWVAGLPANGTREAAFHWAAFAEWARSSP